MAKRLYVGGLPYETTDDELKELFSEAGAVESAKVVTDRYSGRSRGFGFVEMSNDDEAMKAIESMNGKQIGERAITVNEAKPMGERTEGRGGFGGGPRRGGFGGGRGGGFGRQY
ncbi:MAG: RNA-binding protein [Patescibacteria group bacterium]